MLQNVVEYRGSGFLWISVVCGIVFIFQKVLDSRKLVIEPENFCLRLIRLKKCREMGDIRLGKCKNICVVLVLALILTTQAFLNYTLSNIIVLSK